MLRPDMSCQIVFCFACCIRTDHINTDLLRIQAYFYLLACLLLET